MLLQRPILPHSDSAVPMSIDDHGAEHEQSMIVRDPLGDRII